MRFTFLTIFLLIFLSGFSQDDANELVTDRPDQTESAVTVGAGKFQIEIGTLYRYDKSPTEESIDRVYHNSLLRLGLLENMEFRLGFGSSKSTVENIIEQTKYIDKGWDPVSLGLKTEISAQNGLLPEMAVLTTFIISNEDAPLNKVYTGFDFRLAAAHQISDKLGLGYNFGTEWNGASPAPTYFYSLAAGFSITPVVGFFLEPFGYIHPTGPPEHILDAGFTVFVLQTFQIDLSGGIGLNATAPDYFISGGLSFKL